MVRVGDIVFKEKHILKGLVDMAQITQNFFLPLSLKVEKEKYLKNKHVSTKHHKLNVTPYKVPEALLKRDHKDILKCYRR